MHLISELLYCSEYKLPMCYVVKLLYINLHLSGHLQFGSSKPVTCQFGSNKSALVTVHIYILVIGVKGIIYNPLLIHYSSSICG